MTFERIHIYPVSISVMVGVMLGLPALVLAIRHQSSDQVLRRHLLLVAAILGFGASLFTLAAFRIVGPTEKLLALGTVWFVVAFCVAVLAFLLLRFAGRGGGAM